MRNYLTVTVLLLTATFTGARAASPEAEAHMSVGRELFAAGRHYDAGEEFTRARALLATSDLEQAAEADYYIAVCAMETGERDASAALIAYLDKYKGSPYLNDVRFALAAEACKREAFDEASQYFAQVNYAALAPEQRAQYDIRTGYIAFVGGRYREAAEHFDKVPLTSEYADHATYYRAYISYAEGDYTSARRGFQSLESRAPYSRLVPFYLLQIEFNEGNYAYVVERGDELLEHAAGNSRRDLERIMSESWFKLENYGKSAEYMDRYKSSGGDIGRSENYITGYSLYRTGRYSEASEYLRRVCGPDDRLTQNASYHLADCMLRTGNKQAAMHSFAMASNDAFDARIAEDALFNYGKLQYETGGGAFNGAINVLTRYIDKYPASERVPEARELLIAAYYNSRDYDAAYEAIRQQPSPDAGMRAALQKITYFRGLQSFSAGDMSSASRNLRESLASGVSPKYNALALFWQGEIAYAEGDYDTARRRYEDYLARAPKSEREYALAHYNIGYTYVSSDDPAGGRANFERFTSLYPSRDDYRTDALNRIADAHYAERRYDEAARNYSSAAAAGTPSSDYARYRYAITLGVQGRIADKIAALERAEAAGGEYADDAAYELGRTYMSQERFADGARALERFTERYPSSPYAVQALTDLGLACQNLGEDERSLTYYKRVVETAPGSRQAKDAVQGIREIYVSRGDAEGYFAYAESAGVEGDTDRMSRDSLTFAAAQSLYIGGDIRKAERALASYVDSYPKGYYIDDALFYLSDCRLRQGNESGAAESLKRLAARPASQYTERVLERLSSICYDRREYGDAAAAYRSLFEVSSSEQTREKALLGYARSAASSGDAQIVREAADYVSDKRSSGTALREIRFALAEVEEHAGAHDRAVALYTRLSAEPSTREGAESAYRLILDDYAAKRYDEAEKRVYALSESGTPQSKVLARAFLTLGDIYAARGDMFQARATYQSVADGYSPSDDGVVDEARARISALK
ncbi:MAG: tetratricopeptide repeat protein [Alistipes sp.]|nr:tetratricopeptide repeat protein [Alistipes sp.]